MKVLWFEVTEPSAYISNKAPIAGWQDSLERIVRTIQEIDLTIAFMSESYSEIRVIDGVTYVPIYARWSKFEKILKNYWDTYVKKMLPPAKKIIDDYQPDLIHIFGTEWPFGQIATITDVPIVIHIMGSIVPYNNANFPPNYSYIEVICRNLFFPKKILTLWKNHRNRTNWEKWERSTWSLVCNYMGRTAWDEALSNVMHPGRNYYHVEEALRLSFFDTSKKWSLQECSKMKLISTGCSSFWKGPDMMLKVAKILMDLNIDFEWYVAGKMNNDIKKIVEGKEQAKFEDCNIQILGFVQSAELVDLLCSSSIYVHTAYIENSPNSICEAQCLGLPIVSTNVGGISTLVRHEVDGILVPANDPWQMANALIKLFADKKRMVCFSKNTCEFARERHADANICNQLISCYKKILVTQRS